MELLVSMALGSLLMTLVMSATIVNKETMGRDFIRTRLNQNLRGALDVVGFDVRLSGENLPNSFPAIELVNGTTATAPDQLTIRRNLLDEVLNLCTTVTVSTNAEIVFSPTGATTPSACVYANNATNYNSWRNYRLGKGGTVKAFIWDRVNKVGEFFNYGGETSAGSKYAIQRSGGTWSRTYLANTASIYILEEWTYRVQGDILQLVENQNVTTPYNVSFGIRNFQVSITDTAGTTYTGFNTTNNWKLIRTVTVDITGQEVFQKKNMLRTLTGTYFPRNVLSS